MSDHWLGTYLSDCFMETWRSRIKNVQGYRLDQNMMASPEAAAAKTDEALCHDKLTMNEVVTSGIERLHNEVSGTRVTLLSLDCLLLFD